MTTYVPPVKNDPNGLIFYLGLKSQATSGVFQSNPTLASGDVKISKDGGALANLNTLPSVAPASSKMVKVTLNQSETNADNITIVFSDAAGAEWCDAIVNIQTAARHVDDLAYPATSGRSMNVGSDGVVESNLKQILATALTETAGQIAAGFKKVFDVGSPVFTAASVNQTGDSYARIGAPAGASVSADIAAVPTANGNADALLDRAAGVETGKTLRQSMRLMLAALVGKASGLATSTATYRDTGDSKDRIVATVDVDGNRSAVTLDAS